MDFTGDLIYGGFAFGATAMTLLSVIKANRTRSAGGVSHWTPFYFALWSTFNLFVFTLSTAPISFFANLLLLTMNWLYFAVVLRNERLEKNSKISVDV